MKYFKHKIVSFNLILQLHTAELSHIRRNNIQKPTADKKLRSTFISRNNITVCRAKKATAPFHLINDNFHKKV